MNIFYLSHIFKIHNFQGQKHFSTKCVQMGYKKNVSSILFALLIINVQILSNLKKEWYTFGKEKHLKKIRIIQS